jgi:hypothetical protein
MACRQLSRSAAMTLPEYHTGGAAAWFQAAFDSAVRRQPAFEAAPAALAGKLLPAWATSGAMAVRLAAALRNALAFAAACH